AVAVDGELVALRLLADRRDELAGARTRTANRLHRLLLELIPAGASEQQLRTAVAATGSRLPDLYGIGPVGAARILGDVGDIAASGPRPTSPRGPGPPRS